MLQVQRILIGITLLSLAACGNTGTASCKEECTSNDDCQSGLHCLNTARYGMACVPKECQACYDGDDSCSWEENLSEQSEGEEATCTFRECSI